MRPSPALVLVGVAAACADRPQPSDPTPDGCTGWGDPQSIDEVVARLDDLPERSIPCVVQSLDRPVDVMAVASVFSAQPGTWYSPRLFLFTDGLVLSVVPEGVGANLLELGEWVEVGRTSLKGELVFPLEEGPADPFGHLAYGDGTTCGQCHINEQPTDVELAFVSEAIPPTLGSRVPLDDVWEQTQRCDDATEPERCAILRAVMGTNDVTDAVFPTP